MFASYILLSIIVLGMNVVPALMPPTWAVLAFFVTKYDLQIIPTVIIGAACATLGRVILANLARYFRRYLPKDSQENYQAIGNYLNSHKKLTIPLIIIYAFFPIPSNDVYIAAGLAKVRLKIMAGSFFAGRLISYTFWVNLTQRLADNLVDIFSKHYSNLIGPVIVEIAGLLTLYIIGKIAWKKVLKRIGAP